MPSLLILSVLPLFGLDVVVSAQYPEEYGSAVFCPNNFVEGLDTDSEVYTSSWTCAYVHWLLCDYYSYYHSSSFWHELYIGDNRTNPVDPEDYSYVLSFLQQWCDKVVFFSKGHCTPWGSIGRHRQLLCSLSDEGNNYQAKDSIHIFPYTDQYKCRFAFIWHCGTINSHSPPWLDQDGPVSMPLAFTHNVGMARNGNSGSCIFLGFSWASPQFTSKISYQNPDKNWWYCHFAYLFFENLSYGDSVWEAINDVCYSIYGCYYQNSPIYDSLWVLGNRDMTLEF
ncbi:MAG: hypothetical protein QXU99_03195 [Candidatus Bathyarchaeia archaeon]